MTAAPVAMASGNDYQLAGRRLLFIVGSPRSGTTWLHMLLTRSPAIGSAFETHLFAGYMRSNFERWRRWAAADHVMGLHHLLDEPAYFAILRDFAAAVLAKVSEDKPSARFILEKTPAHGAFADDILALFPDAFFIHLIRDPRAVVASLLAASQGWAADIKGLGIPEACEIWVRSVESGQRIASLTENYVELRYEDLLRDGAVTLHRILEQIGEPTSVEQCEAFIAECSFDKVSARRDQAPDTASGKLPDDFFRTGKADAWQNELSQAQTALVNQLTSPTMRRLGYTSERPTNVVALQTKLAVSVAQVRKSASWRLARFARRLWVQ